MIPQYNQYEILCCWCVIPLWLTIEGPHIQREFSQADLAKLAGWTWSEIGKGYQCPKCEGESR